MKQKRRMRTLIIVLVIALIAATVVYVLRYNPFFRRVSDSAPVEIYTTDGTKQNYFEMYGNRLLVINNDGINAINKDGTIGFNVPVFTGEPIFRVASKYIILADKRGKEAQLIVDGTVQANVRTESDIIACSVNSTGRFVLVTNESGYRSKVCLYNQRGQEEYVWKIASHYVIDACVSNDGKKLVAAVLSIENNQLYGGVTFADTETQNIMDAKLEKDKIVSRVGFTDSDILVAVGENSSEGYNRNGGLIWSLDYNGRQLQTFGFEQENVLVLAFDNAMNNTGMEVYSTNDGKLKGSGELDYEVLSVDMVSDTILAVGARCLGLFSTNGAERVRINSERELRYGGLMNNKSDTFIVGGTMVETIRP